VEAKGYCQLAGRAKFPIERFSRVQFLASPLIFFCFLAMFFKKVIGYLAMNFFEYRYIGNY
jgi:hypothetical protein